MRRAGRRPGRFACDSRTMDTRRGARWTPPTPSSTPWPRRGPGPATSGGRGVDPAVQVRVGGDRHPQCLGCHVFLQNLRGRTAGANHHGRDDWRTLVYSSSIPATGIAALCFCCCCCCCCITASSSTSAAERRRRTSLGSTPSAAPVPCALWCWWSSRRREKEEEEYASRKRGVRIHKDAAPQASTFPGRHVWGHDPATTRGSVPFRSRPLRDDRRFPYLL